MRSQIRRTDNARSDKKSCNAESYDEIPHSPVYHCCKLRCGFEVKGHPALSTEMLLHDL